MMFFQKSKPFLTLLLFVTFLANCSPTLQDRLRIYNSALKYFKKGNEALSRGIYHDAVVNYRKAVQIDPSSAEFHYNLGLAYYHAELYVEAKTAFKRSLQFAKKAPETYYNLALAHYQLGEDTDAHEAYQNYQNLMQTQATKQGITPQQALPNPQQQGIATQATQQK